MINKEVKFQIAGSINQGTIIDKILMPVLFEGTVVVISGYLVEDGQGRLFNVAAKDLAFTML